MTLPWRYKSHQASEKILPRDPKFGYVGCRFSAGWAATAWATLGESAQSQTGRFKSRWSRRKDLERAWDAAGRGREGYNQGHVLRAHAAMFPGLPDPILAATRDFSDDLWAHLGQKPTGPREGDFVISIALDLSVLPASDPLRKHTGPVGHQVVLAYRNKANDAAYVLDGMAPYSSGDRGYWAPRRSIAKAARAIEEGLVIFELYPVGGWTRERLGDDVLQRRIQRLRAEMAALEDGYKGEIEELERAAEEARDALGDERATVIDEAIVALQQLR